MPDDAAPRGADSLILTEQLRLLACAFDIRSNSADFIARLGYLAQRAEQYFPLEQRCTIEVMQSDDGLRISDDSGVIGSELSTPGAFEALYERMHKRALDRLPEHIRIHAASGMAPQGVFLLVGPKRSGKTTLVLRLLADGYDVTGDELVLLRDGQAVAFPRKFYVREGSLGLLPQVEALKACSPFVSNAREGRLIAVDPTRFGRPWHIRPARVAAIFFIEPNHGARSVVTPCRKVDMVRRIVSECTPPASGRPDWIADLCRTVDQAETVTIRLGELDSAALAITELLR